MARMARAISGRAQMAFTLARFSDRDAGLEAANSLATAMSRPDQQVFSRHRGIFSPRENRSARSSFAAKNRVKVSI